MGVCAVLSHVRLLAAPWTVAHQGPSIHGISQSRILEWVAIAYSRGSSWPRDVFLVSPALALQRPVYHCATWEASWWIHTLCQKIFLCTWNMCSSHWLYVIKRRRGGKEDDVVLLLLLLSRFSRVRLCATPWLWGMCRSSWGRYHGVGSSLQLFITQLCPTLCDPMDCSTPGFPVLHHLLEFASTHVYWVGDAI